MKTFNFHSVRYRSEFFHRNLYFRSTHANVELELSRVDVYISLPRAQGPRDRRQNPRARCRVAFIRSRSPQNHPSGPGTHQSKTGASTGSTPSIPSRGAPLESCLSFSLHPATSSITKRNVILSPSPRRKRASPAPLELVLD